MTCENCGAALRLSRDQGLMICDYCGSQSAPKADEEGVVVLDPTKHNCPACATFLSNASLESRDLLYCTNCHGMLLEMEKLLPLLEVLREHRYWSRSSNTPRVAGSVLWLDRGELSRMIAAPDRDPRDLGTSASDMLEMDSARTGFN
jgi:Zn-finger nucleic acid-binding protein